MYSLAIFFGLSFEIVISTIVVILTLSVTLIGYWRQFPYYFLFSLISFLCLIPISYFATADLPDYSGKLDDIADDIDLAIRTWRTFVWLPSAASMIGMICAILISCERNRHSKNRMESGKLETSDNPQETQSQKILATIIVALFAIAFCLICGWHWVRMLF